MIKKKKEMLQRSQRAFTKAVQLSQQQCSHRRSLAIAASPVQYNRKGDQVPIAPSALKTVSKSTNGGVTIATNDGRGPVSTLAIVIGAGSRHESVDALGTAHFLKSTLVRVSYTFSVLQSFLLLFFFLSLSLSLSNFMIFSNRSKFNGLALSGTFIKLSTILDFNEFYII
jgi:hypothetical protein